MSKGGYRPNSGRKKGSIPWNKGLHSGNHGNGWRKGQTAWNKGVSMSDSMKAKMAGNTNGHGNKGRTLSAKTKQLMRLAKLGKPSPMRGRHLTDEWRKNLSESCKKRIVTDADRKKNRLGQYKRYLKVNPNYRVATRNSRLASNGGFHSEKEWLELKKSCNFTCLSCKKAEPEIKLTRDHVLPLLLGGTNDIKNIQPLCQLCNSKKHIQSIKY